MSGDPVRHASESLVGAAFASTPFWMHALNEGFVLIAAGAGAVVAIVRGYIAVVEFREWLKRRADAKRMAP